LSNRCDKKEKDFMAYCDDLLSRLDSTDIKVFEGLVTRAIIAKCKIESAFFELAESIFEISTTKLYKVKNKTFAEFCEEELGFSLQPIYIYIEYSQID